LHHIAADGTSLTPLWRDLSTAYAARTHGQAPAWAPLPVQYADYTLWQERWLGTADDAASVTSRELAYWREALAGLPEELALPTDRPRPRVASYRGGTVPIEVGAELLARLRQLARDENVSLFMVLQGALAVLLSRLGAGTDIPLGSPIAGRLDEALQDQIGFYVNTLVLRTDVSGNPTFREVLRRVRQFDLAAFGHQELPFERLVQELQPSRSLARHPLFQVMLVLQNTGIAQETLGDLAIAEQPLPATTSRFDLLWNLAETAEGGLNGTLEYADELYDEETARTLTARLGRVLQQVAAAPQQPLAEFELLLPGERERLTEWGRGPAQLLPAATVGEWIESQTRRTPDAVAVVFGAETWTYRELDRRAARLAGVLAARGVGRDSVVGLSVARSPDMVAAMLAIWKTGGAYLPLDPTLPAARLQYLVEDSGVRLAVVDHDDWRGWSGPEVEVVDLRQTNGADGAEAAAVPRSPGDPEALAYILYTSGSTGRPKGVEVTQRCLVNLLESMRRAPGCGPQDVVLAITTYTFDISLLELFLPLVSGARMVLAETATLLEPARLAVLIDQRGVTLAQGTPVTWRMRLADHWRPGNSRRVLWGGEAFPDDLARDLSSRVSQLWNVYGPTETTVWSTACLVGSARLRTSIGRPVGNTQVYVLDEQRRLVPLGNVGQLWIGGTGVARGYRARPELTAEKFVADPFSQEPGARMYATGDLARWSAEGNLECLGRIDHQVKIRGLRIELEEIEAVLRTLPGVAEAAVTVAGEATRLNERLVAHVVAVPGATLDLDALRQSLRSQLPEYMVPTVLPPLTALPLTSSGKVDRR
ncbi:MAG: non-ribosomal peptide synthetase, partial [Planctomycetaceae bacterium]